jgi:signal transduction histidine kinase
VSDALLREKAALLLRRDRDFHGLRQRFARALRWLEAVEAMSALTRRGRIEHLAEEWPRFIVAQLKFQSAALWRVGPGGDTLTLVSYAGGTPPAATHREGVGWLGARLDAEPEGLDNGAVQGDLGALLGLRRFLWCTLSAAPGERHLTGVGYNAATFAFHPPFIAEDLRFASLNARLLEAMLGQLGSIRDLTLERQHLRALNEELTRRERELYRAREELLESTRLAAVGELAGVTAHEVLNPVTSIQGRLTRMLGAQDETFEHNRRSLAAIPAAWAGSLSRGGLPALGADLSAPSPLGGTLAEEDVAVLGELVGYFGVLFAGYRDDVAFLQREIRRVTDIVDGMRGLGRRRTSAAPTPLRALCVEALDVLADSFQQHHITPTLRCDEDLGVEVDRYEAIQVLTNLLRNAVLAIAERGRGVGAIAVRVEHAGDAAWLCVEDDGAGIRPEHEPHLFEMRFSTRAESAGTGLGLSIARRLVRGWRGDLRLAWTRPGEGTCFLIELPLVADGPEGHLGEGI